MTALLHAHIQEFGVQPDGRLFVGERTPAVGGSCRRAVAEATGSSMCHGQHSIQSHVECSSRYAKRMTVRDMLTALQTLPRDAELLAFEAGCEDYCEREVDEVEWQGGRVFLHLGARRDDPPRG